MEAEALFIEFKDKIEARLALFPGSNGAIVGIHTGGALLARRLHEALREKPALGFLDISFYRDDVAMHRWNPLVRPSSIPFDVEGAHIILVDDVLHTGRTVRAAMNEIFDYGRPAEITLAVLVDRGGRELPICAQVAAAHIEVPADIHLDLKEDLHGKLVIEQKPWRRP